MNNAELFKKVFGIYAEEFWAYPEEKMLDWLTSNAVPDRNVGGMIFRQDAIDVTWEKMTYTEQWYVLTEVRRRLKALPPAQTEDYAELKREFILMASYIDAILRCSDEQKETLNWFISRLAELMPWKERD